MDSTWDIIRLINLCVLFISFVLMIYKGVFRLVRMKHSFLWDRFMSLAWVALAIYTIGEVFYQSNTDGGFRVVLMSVIALLQLYVVIFRYNSFPQPTDRLEDWS